jgi:hypothetical protein
MNTVSSVGHLELVLEVRHGAQPADERAGAAAPRVFHQQSTEGIDLDVRILAEHFADDGDALIGRKQRILLRIHQHRDDDPLEQVRAAKNDVDVAVGQRIEGPWKNRESTLRRTTGHLSLL